MNKLTLANDNVFLVKHFPNYMYPFWNMKQTNHGLNEQSHCDIRRL